LFQGEKKKKTKTITEKYWDWELSNETKPIWVSYICSMITTFESVSEIIVEIYL
jgi:Hsp90 protein